VTLVLLAVRPDYPAEALHHVLLEVSLVDRSVGPCELALSVLEALKVLSLVGTVVHPFLYAKPMLDILEPLSGIV
jgi:hypothetical protein